MGLFQRHSIIMCVLGTCAWFAMIGNERHIMGRGYARGEDKALRETAFCGLFRKDNPIYFEHDAFVFLSLGFYIATLAAIRWEIEDFDNETEDGARLLGVVMPAAAVLAWGWNGRFETLRTVTMVVTTWACGIGSSSPVKTLPATSPAKCAMSTQSLAPTSSAIARNASKSSWRG